MRESIAGVLSACTLAICTTAAGAQTETAVRGVVNDDAGRPIGSVEVILTPGDRTARTDSAGRFRLAGLTAGRYVLLARRIGFMPVEHEIDVRSGETLEISLVLEPSPVQLDTVTTTTAARCPPLTFAGFHCRQRTGAGVYLDVAAIDSAEVREVKGLFWNRPGFRITPTGVEATSGWRCLVSLVNGRRPSAANPMPRLTTELIGVEIYESPNDVPEPYQRWVWGSMRSRRYSLRCSVVVYWTVVRPRTP